MLKMITSTRIVNLNVNKCPSAARIPELTSASGIAPSSTPSVDSFSGSIRVHMSSLRKKLKAGLGYDPIVNKIGEGYKIGGNSKA